MTNVVRYGGNQGSNTPNLQRTYSPFLWANCPVREIRDGVVDGVYVDDDFTNPAFTVPTTEANFGAYKAFTSSGGTLLPTTPEYGGILMLSSDGDDEGASIATVGLPFAVGVGYGDLWFEARLKTSTITDSKHGFVVGLWGQQTLTATVPIAADGTLAVDDFIGWHRLEGDGDKVDAVYCETGASAPTTVEADAGTLEANTYFKVGLKWTEKTLRLGYYFNGVLVDYVQVADAATDTPTDFPHGVPMGLCMAVLNATATTPGNTIIDRWRCYQIGSSAIAAA